jgi:hypothetical protein
VKQYIGCDAHPRYSVFVSVDETGRIGAPVRVDHFGRDLRDYLQGLEKETPVAVEASGGWYWFMDELEAAGLDARLVSPLEAKRRIGGRNKTDKLDARGLAILLRNGTLAGGLDSARDKRGFSRTVSRASPVSCGIAACRADFAAPSVIPLRARWRPA